MEKNIIYEDEHIIVCYKPAGTAVQTKRIGQQDMESLLKNYLAGKGETPIIWTIHRLDQPVCGVMVFGKTKEAAANLSRQMQQKSADKYYYAVTDGIPKEKCRKLEDYLLRDGKTNTSKVVNKDTKNAKRAELFYEVISQNKEQALLRIQLETGRHHQIRVQLSHAGFPISGDTKYNVKENKKANQLALCSYKIAFQHPITRKKMEFEIENPFTV